MGTVSDVLPNGLDDVATWLSLGLKDGHQFRPYLFLALNDQLRNSGVTVDEDLLNVAASIEIVHQASLIVDDVTDEHDLRGESRTALHAKHGHGIAATLSHLLVTASERLIASTRLDPEKKITALNLMTRTKMEMALGQFADVFLSTKPDDITWVDWCLDTAYLKTRALMAVPFEATAIVKGYSHQVLQDLKGSGDALGTVYQIGDDIRDMEPIQGPLTLSLGLAHLLDKNPGAKLLEELVATKRIDQENVAALREVMTREQDSVFELATKKVDEKSAISLALLENTSGKFSAEEVVSLVRNIIQKKRHQF